MAIPRGFDAGRERTFYNRRTFGARDWLATGLAVAIAVGSVAPSSLGIGVLCGTTRHGRPAALGRFRAPGTSPSRVDVPVPDRGSDDEEYLFGEPVVSRRQLDPREDHVGLYLWGTIVWHLLILFRPAVLIVGRNMLVF